MLEVFGPRLRLPERGPIGSNGLADARHFLAPVASYEDRLCPAGFELVHKLGGRLFTATQEHSPFDVVAWHGNHAPSATTSCSSTPMGSVKFDHPDPSILTVLTAPLDDHGRAVADFVVFPRRWDVARAQLPPAVHASERRQRDQRRRPDARRGGGYDAGLHVPLAAPHGARESRRRPTSSPRPDARSRREGPRAPSRRVAVDHVRIRRSPSASARGRSRPRSSTATSASCSKACARFDPTKR